MPDISKILRGTVRIITLHGADAKTRPPAGKAWLILGGCIYHVNGTDTIFYLADAALARLLFYQYIPAATASGFINIFQQTALANASLGQYSPYVVTPDWWLGQTGNSSVDTRIEVVEFEY